MPKRTLFYVSTYIGLMLVTAACGGGPNGDVSKPDPTEDTRPEIITALVDVDPVITSSKFWVAMRFVVQEPVARGFTLGEVFVAKADKQNAAIAKGTVVELDCPYGHNSDTICDVTRLVATPTPPASK